MSKWGKLAKKKYEQRHDIGRYVQWQFSEELGFSRATIWYKHEPESVVENFKIMYDFTILCDHMIEARRPNIGVVNKLQKETTIKNVAIPGGKRVCDKERENIAK